MIQRGLYLARKAGANYTLADGEISLGVCYAERGELETAERVLSEGLRLAESIPHLYLAIHAMLALAKIKLELGSTNDLRVALMQAEDSLERSVAADMRWGMVSAHTILARAHHALGEPERALHHIETAHKLVQEGEVYGREDVYEVLALVLQGRQRD